MGIEILLNNQSIDALNFSEESIMDSSSQKSRRKIVFDFKVTSESYHDMAILLYEMEFRVRIPEKDMDFQASIANYSTSVTNLYLDGQVADYHLELIEKPQPDGQ